jgi:hypothetical protein
VTTVLSQKAMEGIVSYLTDNHIEGSSIERYSQVA